MIDDTTLSPDGASHRAVESTKPFLQEVAIYVGVSLLAGAWIAANVAFTEDPTAWTSAPSGQVHVGLNLAAMLLSALWSSRLRGSLDYKLTRALINTGFVFGLYALIILAARLYFSRALLTSACVGGFICSVVIVWLRHRLTRHRVAVIVPLLDGAVHSAPQGRLINEPAEDLRSYDVALVSLNQTISADWAKALSRAMLAGCKVRHLGEFVEEQRGAVSLEHFEIDHVRGGSISSYRPIKRILDIALCAMLLPLVLPALLVGGLGILISSGRPVFFVQNRVGLGGRRFRMWKLRTMRPVEPGDGIQAAVAGDQRITRFGRVLRRSRIDEMPQIWNVLKGDMSVIGPRPEAEPLHLTYLEKIPNYAYRYLVRPGITGWAQVKTPPSAMVDQARRKLAYDLFYVKRVSFGLDLQIIAKTIWAIANGLGVH